VAALTTCCVITRTSLGWRYNRKSFALVAFRSSSVQQSYEINPEIPAALEHMNHCVTASAQRDEILKQLSTDALIRLVMQVHVFPVATAVAALF
jgi:archaellum biogenesis protein FlaJ (TadC family)